MSASDKKKLRKEQTAADFTERQLNEKKTQKKQSAYTVTFIVVMVLVAAIFLTSVLISPIKNLGITSSTAITVNGHKVGGREFNYFYVDSIQTFCSDFASYGNYAATLMQMYGLNPNASLDSQIFNEETGDTWVDYFSKSALESVKWTYAMYDEAMAKGFALTEDQKESIAYMEEYLKVVATNSNMSVNEYIRNIYGSTANLKSYLEYYELTAVATLYASEYYDSLEFSNEDFRNHEKNKYNEYSSYSYATVTIDSSTYLSGGEKVTDEDGKTTTVYTDEEKKAALDAALADVNTLIADETIKDADTFNTAIAALEEYDEKKTCTEVTETLYSNLNISNEEMKAWLTSDEREAGDIAHFENKTTTDDVETVTGYTVILFLNCNDNTSYEGTVRHLLVAFEGTTDANGNTTYTDEQKEVAAKKAAELLAEYDAGAKTEEAFIALQKEHSDDVDSKGNLNNDGIYEHVSPASNYVAEFENWAYADHEPGDTGIIETTYGYHIMYYVEDGEHTYRDILIEAELAKAAYTEWEEALVAGVKVVEGKPRVNGDFIIPSSFYSSSYSAY